MTSAQVVETSVTKNSSFQNYPHPDDHTMRTNPDLSARFHTLKMASTQNELLQGTFYVKKERERCKEMLVSWEDFDEKDSP